MSAANHDLQRTIAGTDWKTGAEMSAAGHVNFEWNRCIVEHCKSREKPDSFGPDGTALAIHKTCLEIEQSLIRRGLWNVSQASLQSASISPEKLTADGGSDDRNTMRSA
jgi:hypothetical protein